MEEWMILPVDRSIRVISKGFLEGSDDEEEALVADDAEVNKRILPLIVMDDV